jgi:hypothetical protein
MKTKLIFFIISIAVASSCGINKKNSQQRNIIKENAVSQDKETARGVKIIIKESTNDPIILKARSILIRSIEERTAPIGGRSHEERHFTKNILLLQDKQIPAEGFKIEKISEDEIHITGGDGPGILYGCGKLLRLSEISQDTIIFHDSPEVNVPVKQDRGIYFAVHNFNVYQVAPAPFIERYIEELALWGINDIAVCFHKFHFNGIAAPETAEYIDRLNLILRTAKSVGMKSTLLIVANDGYSNSPESLRYKGKIPRNWGTEICVSAPGGMDLIKREFEEILNAVNPVDQVVMWPYDSGGCGCDQCFPWGANGFIRTAKELSRLFRKIVPYGKYYLATWYFDYNCGNISEWDSLFTNLTGKKLNWIDGILADGAFVNDYFPHQVVDNHIDKPVISFLEISMLTGSPWGGFGSNPVPEFIQRQWNYSKDYIIGGIPYSEGIYEDINKILWAQLCWSPEKSVINILSEYVSYEFSREYTAEITAAIASLEPARKHNGLKMVNDFSGSVKVWNELSYYDRCLGWHARNSWRWKQTLLRSKIDAELAISNGKPNPELGRAYDELFRLYYLDDRAFGYIRPLDVIPDNTKGGHSLKFFQRGKSLIDFSVYRNKKDN